VQLDLLVRWLEQHSEHLTPQRRELEARWPRRREAGSTQPAGRSVGKRERVSTGKVIPRLVGRRVRDRLNRRASLGD